MQGQMKSAGSPALLAGTDPGRAAFGGGRTSGVPSLATANAAAARAVPGLLGKPDDEPLLRFPRAQELLQHQQNVLMRRQAMRDEAAAALKSGDTDAAAAAAMRAGRAPRSDVEAAEALQRYIAHAQQQMVLETQMREMQRDQRWRVAAQHKELRNRVQHEAARDHHAMQQHELVMQQQGAVMQRQQVEAMQQQQHQYQYAAAMQRQQLQAWPSVSAASASAAAHGQETSGRGVQGHGGEGNQEGQAQGQAQVSPPTVTVTGVAAAPRLRVGLPPPASPPGPPPLPLPSAMQRDWRAPEV